MVKPALMVALAVGSAAAEPPPRLGAHEAAALKGWAHVEFGASEGYKITNGVDSILFRRLPSQLEKPYETVNGPDGRAYTMGTLSCGDEAYLVVGDFGGRSDARTIAPLKAFECPGEKADAFKFPDEAEFQELLTARDPRRFRPWLTNGQPGPFALYLRGDEALTVAAALPSNDRTPAGKLAQIESLTFGDRKETNRLQTKTYAGATLYVGRSGETAGAALILTCERGTLFVASRVEHGRVEQAVATVLSLRCRTGRELSLRALATPTK